MAGPGLPTSITAGTTTGHATNHVTAHGILNRFNDVAVTNGFGLVGVAGLWTPTPVYPQCTWNGSVWTARPAVPAGVVVYYHSATAIAATPPADAVTEDKWFAHPDSAYWP